MLTKESRTKATCDVCGKEAWVDAEALSHYVLYTQSTVTSEGLKDMHTMLVCHKCNEEFYRLRAPMHADKRFTFDANAEDNTA